MSASVAHASAYGDIQVARVAGPTADRAQLADEGQGEAQAFGRHPLRRRVQVLVQVDPQHAAGKGPLPGMGRLRAAPEQYGKAPVDDRKDRQFEAHEGHRVGGDGGKGGTRSVLDF